MIIQLITLADEQLFGLGNNNMSNNEFENVTTQITNSFSKQYGGTTKLPTIITGHNK